MTQDNYRIVQDSDKTAYDPRAVARHQTKLDPNQVYSFDPMQSDQKLQAGDYRRRHEDWVLNPKTPLEVSHIALVRGVTENTRNGLLAVNEAKKLEN